MSPAEQSTKITSAENRDDRGARIAHLLDCIGRAAGTGPRGLRPHRHVAQSVGAMHSSHDESVFLVTLIDTEGESHVFALDRRLAFNLRVGLSAEGASLVKERGPRGQIADVTYRAALTDWHEGRGTQAECARRHGLNTSTFTAWLNNERAREMRARVAAQTP